MASDDPNRPVWRSLPSVAEEEWLPLQSGSTTGEWRDVAASAPQEPPSPQERERWARCEEEIARMVADPETVGEMPLLPPLERCCALPRCSAAAPGPPPCELYSGSLLFTREHMQRQCALCETAPHVCRAAAREIARACDGANPSSAANRAMLVAHFAPVVKIMVTHACAEVRACGQSVLKDLLLFGDETAIARMGAVAYDPRGDATLALALALAQKLCAA